MRGAQAAAPLFSWAARSLTLSVTPVAASSPSPSLEHALSSFTCLTAGDTISIRVGHTTHALTVASCMPETKAVGAASAVCVVGAHLSVDFLPPLEVEPESEKPLEVVCGSTLEGQIASQGTYRYFRGRNVDGGSALVIEVAAREGDPEIVVSTQTGKPTLTSATWKSISTVSSGTGVGAGAGVARAAAGTKQIVINPDSLGFIVGWYFIGVFVSEEAVSTAAAPAAAGQRMHSKRSFAHCVFWACFAFTFVLWCAPGVRCRCDFRCDIARDSPHCNRRFFFLLLLLWSRGRRTIRRLSVLLRPQCEAVFKLHAIYLRQESSPASS